MGQIVSVCVCVCPTDGGPDKLLVEVSKRTHILCVGQKDPSKKQYGI